MTDTELIERFPAIHWRTPITVNGHLFCCRLCIAHKGLKVEDIKHFPHTAEEFSKHMAFTHGLSAELPQTV